MSRDDLVAVDALTEIDSLTVTKTKRVVTDYWIEIEGHRFDAKDVYESLQQTCTPSSDSYISDRDMIKVMQNLFVIEHGGSRRWGMPAKKGPNYDRFIIHLGKLINDPNEEQDRT